MPVSLMIMVDHIWYLPGTLRSPLVRQPSRHVRVRTGFSCAHVFTRLWLLEESLESYSFNRDVYLLLLKPTSKNETPKSWVIFTYFRFIYSYIFFSCSIVYGKSDTNIYMKLIDKDRRGKIFIYFLVKLINMHSFV